MSRFVVVEVLSVGLDCVWIGQVREAVSGGRSNRG